MASFFEKLKKGMGVEIYEKEPKKIKERVEKKLPQGTAPKLKAKPTTQALPNKKEVQKPKAELKIEKIKKPEKTEEPEDLKKPEETEREKSEIEPKKEEKLETLRQKFALRKLGGQEGQLAVDVYQTDTEIVIRSAIAGIKSEDLDISIESDSVIIRGVREQPPEAGDKKYFYQECYWGPFSRQIILPEETDPNQSEASMKEGILTIRIPKIEKKEKKKITVKG